jgi:hypothetical protein
VEIGKRGVRMTRPSPEAEAAAVLRRVLNSS